MGEIFGRYDLEQRLAAGGMGEVFLARHAGTGERVVIKRVLPHLIDDHELKALFFSEARLAASVHHPNIARILELGEADGRWFMALEYVDGWSLATVLGAARKAKTPLPGWAVARLALDGAAALQAAHSARDAKGKALGIVHGDVSPHNLLLGRDGLVRLIDFGVARASAQAAVDDSQALRGKYPYLAPEQLEDEDSSPRSDQFSLGVVLWEALAGRRLFEGRHDAHTLELVERCQVPALDSPLGPVVARLLARAPAQRFPTCAEVVRAVEDVVEQEAWREGPRHLASLARRLTGEVSAVHAALVREPKDVPEPTSAFVGREAVLARVMDEVGEHSAVTVVGPSGSGTSRLVRRVARQLGADVVDVEGLSPEEAAAAIAAAPGRGLLVVDGAQAAFASVRAVLCAASRPLGLEGEVTVALPPLEPEEAAALFAERAQRAAEGPLPGSPLAVELLAGLTGVAAVEVEGAISVGWPMLAPWEQTALRQLATYPRTFTLEELEATVDLAQFANAPWALDVVQALAERGWVQTWSYPELGGELRFRLPVAVRGYAQHA